MLTVVRRDSIAPRTLGARLQRKMDGLDNTVGPVPKISGYVFNTLQTTSAAHVPNSNMNLINDDTHICGLNLYETIFQNWCITESLNVVTPDTAVDRVTPLNANTSSEASTPLKKLSFTGSDLRELSAVEIGPFIFTYFTIWSEIIKW